MVLFGVFLLLKIEVEAGSLTIKIAHSSAMAWHEFSSNHFENLRLSENLSYVV